MNILQKHTRRAFENNFMPNLRRTDRFKINDEGYFYTTREGEVVGPFATLSAASFDLNCFIEVALLEKELNGWLSLEVA